MNKVLYVDREKIITINQKIIKMWNQRHPEKPEFIDVGTNRIDEVLGIVKNVANNLFFEEALIEKSA